MSVKRPGLIVGVVAAAVVLAVVVYGSYRLGLLGFGGRSSGRNWNPFDDVDFAPRGVPNGWRSPPEGAPRGLVAETGMDSTDPAAWLIIAYSDTPPGGGLREYVSKYGALWWAPLDRLGWMEEPPHAISVLVAPGAEQGQVVQVAPNVVVETDIAAADFETAAARVETYLQDYLPDTGF